ncbi:MAG: Hsp33 family molecular chaperone HslO [Thermosulfidibacteraceae bacterium]
MVLGLPEKELIRLYVVKATDTTRIIDELHKPPIMVKPIIGRLIVGTLLLTSLIKHNTNQKILVKLETDGPIKVAAVEADGYGRVRALVDADEDIEIHTKDIGGIKKFDLAKLLIPGHLIVTKDIGIGEPYTTILPLVSGEIGEDLAYYLYKSEQIRSAIGVGVLVNEDGTISNSGGFLLQPVGNVKEKIIEEFEERLKNLPPISSLMKEGKTPEDIANIILEGYNPRIIRLKDIKFFCPCNHEIIKEFLRSVPEKELKALESDEKIKVTCNYCKSKYILSLSDLIQN